MGKYSQWNKGTLDDFFSNSKRDVFVMPKGKRAIGAVPIENLNAGQQDALEKLKDYILDHQSPDAYKLLQGDAGTGKTFMLRYLIEHLAYDHKLNIAVTATTNKAVKVLRAGSDFADRRIKFLTIHKLMKVKAVVDEAGNQKFITDREEKSHFDDYDVVFIDEASMLDNYLFEKIQENARTTKVIFCGDGAQIPPVGCEYSIPFNPELQKQHRIGVIQLAEIVRQKEGSPIIELANAIRQNIRKTFIPIVRKNVSTEQGSITYYNQDNQGDILSTIQKLFVSDEFKKDSDYVKVACWRREAVQNMNNRIRGMIYSGEAADNRLTMIMPGEKLMANSPIMDERNNKDDFPTVLFNTNDEFEVQDFEILTEILTAPRLNKNKKVQDESAFGEALFDLESVESCGDLEFKISYYNAVVVHSEDGGETLTTSNIKILHEDSYSVFNQVLKIYKDVATREKDPDERRLKWIKFYEMKSTYADILYNYAVTSHKSQGSTYKNVIVFESDIDRCWKIYERNRIKYVAVTRTSENLFIIYNKDTYGTDS